jgi:hypothetical protein
MEHKPLSDLGHVADFMPEWPNVAMTRTDRLERWIELLARDPSRRLNTFHEIEHKPADARRASRVDNSPMSVAFSDPVLRADGLASDRVGDAMDFFELSEGDIHRAFCSCFYGESMRAGEVAERLKGMTRPTLSAPIAIWAVGAVTVAVPFLVRLLQ